MHTARRRHHRAERRQCEETAAFAFDSYDVFVDSKKLTSCSVSFAVAIHFAGFDTL
jgi:hypothetical protein